MAEPVVPAPDILLAHFSVSDDVARSERFYTEVLGGETVRWYLRDPDGHLVEVDQTTDPERDWSPARWSSSASGGAST